MKSCFLSKAALAGLTLAAATSLAQSSSVSATSAGATSTASANKVSASKPSALGFSISQQVMGDTKLRETEESRSGQRLFDRDAGYFDAVTSLSGSYKFNNGQSLSIIQRINYTSSIRSDRQTSAGLSAIRFQLSTPVSLMGADGALVLRVAPAHTHSLYHDSNLIGTLALMPSLTWGITPDLSVSYSGYLGGTFYNGPMRDFSDYYKLQINDSAVAAASKKRAAILAEKKQKNELSTLSTSDLDAIDGAMSDGAFSKQAEYRATTAQERNFYILTNNVAVNYKVTSKVKLSQGIGYGIISKEYSNARANAAFLPTAQSVYADLNTGVNVQITPQWSLDVGVVQAQPLLEGSRDPVTGKPYFLRDGFALLYPEQTTYSLMTAVRF